MEKIIIILASSCMAKKLIKGNNMDAIIAPSETYCVIKKTIKNIANEISAVSKLIAKMIPKVVATPLPPRKFANTGKTWPTTAHKEAIS